MFLYSNLWRWWVDKFSSFSSGSESLVSPLASLPISQMFFITLPTFMAPHSRKVFVPFTNGASSTQILVFQCAATTQFTQSSYQTKKTFLSSTLGVLPQKWVPIGTLILHLHLLCYKKHEVQVFPSLQPPLHRVCQHDICEQLQKFIKTFCLFQVWFALHFKINSSTVKCKLCCSSRHILDNTVF